MGDFSRLLLTAIINGVTHGATLFLVAVGLSLIYGVLRILNVTHGSFYALGAFTAASSWLAISMLSLSAYWIYPAMVLSAMLVGIAVGPFLERFMLRWTAGVEPLGQRESIQLLATYAIFLMLEDAQQLIWGSQPYYSGGALSLLGSTQVTGLYFTNYQLLMVPVAIIVLVGMRLFLKKTVTGKFITAVATDPEMSRSLGISVGRIYTIAFTLGTILAALGGALASPTTGVGLGIGAQMMVTSFAVVAVAGLGQIGGTAIAALIIGITQSLAVFFYPKLSSVMPYLIMVAVLVFRPYGLFGTISARRI
jgi:branched-chain amino acid transport system permease protein